MRKAILFSLLLACTVALAACGSASNLDKANGDWVCDVTATIAVQSESKNATPPPTGPITEAIFSSLTLKIDSAAKKLSLSLGKNIRNEDFTVISDSGNTLVLQAGTEKMYFEFTTADSMTALDQEGKEKKLVFVRKK